jgi:tRNA pseudouridine32 synthase / 23S rRNA pseudouridine746 synthase
MTSDIDVLFSDNALVIINKPSGLLSVPGRGPDKADCAIKRAQDVFPTARTVHRLDCATSGLMVFALNADTHRELSRQFHDREVSKRYEALVYGQVAQDQGEVDLPLMTDWPNRPRQIVHEQGKSSQTQFECIERLNDYTRVALRPITGRSHQLRVHMQAIGHPIVGDELYATEHEIADQARLALHACYLAFAHPVDGRLMEFHSDVPF